MKITVLYFGQLKQQAGTASETLEMDDAPVAELYRQLKKRHGLSMPFENLRAARNETFCKGTEAIRADDVIAFMPPMSGG
ncbi:MAG: MoaD/ThiS family protein [Opitutae bacterium]|jgi:sulfur-carrier protein|nr:MoaD/ThiS family protein [Opitutae bacterium]